MSVSPPVLEESPPCANCGTPLLGRWCHHCGQKRWGPEDRRLAHLLGQLLEALTDVDSRFWRTLRTLALSPGRLSRDYLDGRRQRHMLPMTIVLMATLVYFVAPALTDLHLPLIDQVHGPAALATIERPDELSETARARLAASSGQWYSGWITPWVERRVAIRDAQARERGRSYTMADYAKAYDARRGEIAKLLVLIFVPLLAAMLALLFLRRRMLFAEHMVVAAHLFGFLLLFVQLLLVPVVTLVMTRLSQLVAPSVPMLAGLLLVVAYFGAAVRTVYGVGWPRALLSGGLLFIGFGAASLFVYRPLQFLLVFAMT